MALLRRGRSPAPAPVSGGSSAPAIIAAARKVDLGDDVDRRRAERRREEWQAEAWGFYDDIGEARYATNYFANALSRLNLYVGIRPSPQDDPVPLDPAGDRELGYTPQDASICIDALERLDSPQGGKTEIMRRLGVHLFVPGEAYLCGRVDETGERWDIYSTEELRPRHDNTDAWELAIAPEATQAGEALPPDTAVSRIWRQHPRFSSWPDSPMRSALGVCDELLTLTKSIKGSALSRLATAGLLFLPNSMKSRGVVGDESDPPQGEGREFDPVVQELIDVAAAGIADPSSAAAQVPIIQWVDDQVYEQISADKHITWSREVDQNAAAQRAELVTRFAAAIDLPPEIVTGKAALNHWNSWNVDESAFKNHMEPGAILQVQGLTLAYLLPYLVSAGVPEPKRFVVWYDPSRLVTRPNREETAKWAHEALLISDAAARAEVGYSEDDAPDEREAAARAERAKPVAPGLAPVAQRKEPPAREERDEDEEPPAVAAAASPLPAPEEGPGEVRGLAETLGRMDVALFAEVHAEVETRMRRALERANARVQSLAQRDKTVRSSINGMKAARLEVAPALGPGLVAQLANGEDLWRDAWAALEARFWARTGRTVDEVLRLAMDRGEMTETEAEAWRARLEPERSAAWAGLLVGLAALADALLFAPEPVTGPGEVSDRLVPPGLVRDALVRAGGGGTEATGMLSGALIETLWREAGIGFDGWRWEYGDPASRLHGPFEPHHQKDSALNDGAIYTGPEDPRLANPTGWPAAQCWPQDHAGCLCQMVRAIAVRVGRGGTVARGQEAA